MDSFQELKQTGLAPELSSCKRTPPMAKDDASVVSVKGSVGSAGCRTGACVKASLSVMNAAS